MQTAMVRFAVCSLLLMTHAISAATAAAGAPDRFCYSYLFRNDTAATANDLHIGFEDPGGSGAVSDIYLGPDNPFISVTLSSNASPSGTAQTDIAYSNGSASPGELVRIGFCNRVSRMRGVPTWTLDSVPVQPDPQVLGIEWEWRTPRSLKVAVFNDRPVTMTVTSLYLYDAALALSTEALAPDAATGMVPVVNLSEDVLVLAPNSTHMIEVTFGSGGLNSQAASAMQVAEVVSADYAITPNHPYVLGMVSAPIDDLGDESQLILQAYSPQAVYMPLVVR